jgi:hypothetical protein
MSLRWRISFGGGSRVGSPGIRDSCASADGIAMFHRAPTGRERPSGGYPRVSPWAIIAASLWEANRPLRRPNWMGHGAMNKGQA